MRLSTIDNDHTVVVDKIEGDTALSESLEVLGFTPGTKATIISKSPFHGPIAIELRGSRVALRYEDASLIHVQ